MKLKFDGKISERNKFLAERVLELFNDSQINFEVNYEFGDVYFSYVTDSITLTVDIRYDLVEIFDNRSNTVVLLSDEDHFSKVCNIVKSNLDSIT